MKTAEDIIMKKRFFELTPSEKELVKDYATSEEDYEAIRWVMTSAGKAFAEEKVEPSSDLRKNVMAHLGQRQTATKTIWLNGVGAFLFPTDKKFYQLPSVQMAAVAAVVVSVVMIYNQNASMDQDLAVNQQTSPSGDVQQPTTVMDETYKSEEVGGEEQPISNTCVDQNSVVKYAEDAPEMSSQALSDDATPAEELYEREMSTAEEVRYYNSMDAEKNVAEDVESLDAISNESKLSPTLQKEVNLKEDSKKQDSSKDKGKTNKNTASADEDLPNTAGPVTTGTATTYGNATTSGGTVTNTSTNGYTLTETNNVAPANNMNEGEYRTATAGGVFGDTASTKSEGDKADLPANDNTKYSISETKVLRKLIFTVK